MKKLVAFAALTLCATGAFANEPSVIRFGVDPTFAPFESKTPDGKLAGFDIDLGNAICAKLHAKCVWVENAFDGIIPALKARKFDAVLSSMSVTEKRQQEIAFSEKIYATPNHLIAHNGSNLLPTVASLRGKRVGVEQGSIQETYAKTYWEPKGVNVVSYQNPELAYQDLASGRLDASFSDAVAGEYGFLKRANGQGFGFSGPAVQDSKTLGHGVAIGLRKGDDELRLAINKAIAELVKDGTHKRLQQKYFSFSIY
ncbi:ABC transporter substrate-binding protein [Crenobacter sp. SG2303]|uniref:ABC transporter substrate-binding protein n=1 Tax=Crenobacter oryzisoli TaxID=3056844 RepID=A0ABT7XJ05_9NEIS|nr:MULTISPECIES: ABC transporter substrate-binding protein [unclassified Crenobacter]MDN0073703.1 ABC transporter substrate-binding protein [Crenobacter sp. SG2303]MDN0084071.1 ABC transporter substrate-binding protein [Crenobacter sp. SG2305]